MTQEEKAKAYDEALEKARKQRDDYQKELNKTDKNSQLAGLLIAGISALEMAFPELRESEDERIRKVLVSIVKWLGSDSSFFTTNSVTKSEVLAYLEKQKEQSITANNLDEEIHRFFDDCIDVYEAKLYGSISEKVIPVDCYEITARHFAKWGEKHKEEEGYEAIPVESTLEYKLGFKAGKDFERQKEQKPVEKEITLTNFEETLNTFLFGFANSPIEDCEPKEYIKKHSTEILKAAYKELNAKLQQDIFEARQEGIRDGYEVAKAEQKPADLPPGFYFIDLDGKKYYSKEFRFGDMKMKIVEDKSGKPAEWSEEDDEMVEEIKHIVFGAGSVRNGMRGKIHDWLYNRLKYLCPAKQDWSEEDKDYYDAIIAKLEVTQDDALLTDNQIDFLKSLPERFNLQPKQNVNDMITPNKKFFQWIYDRLVNIHNEDPNVDYMLSFKRRIEELPVDEPSWKPSEEQMEAMKQAVKLYKETHFERFHARIESLYEQLKKLM